MTAICCSVTSDMNKQRIINICPFVEIVFECFFCRIRQKDNTNLFTLASHRKLVTTKVKVPRKPTEFRDTEPRGEEEFKDRPIAKRRKTSSGRSRKQAFQVLRGNKVEFVLGGLGELNLLGRHGGDTFPRKVLQKSTQRNKIVVLGAFFEGRGGYAAFAFACHLTVKP